MQKAPDDKELAIYNIAVDRIAAAGKSPMRRAPSSVNWAKFKLSEAKPQDESPPVPRKPNLGDQFLEAPRDPLFEP